MSLLGGLITGFFASRSARKAEARAAAGFRRSGLDNRIAAESGGFNPLTWLQATGGGAAANGGFVQNGPPPLASTEAIIGGIQGLEDKLTGKAAERDKQERLKTELLELELGQLRNASAYMQAPGAVVARTRAAGAAGSVGGGSAFNQKNGASAAPVRTSIMTEIDPTREQMDMPVSSGPGLTVIDNARLAIPVVVPGADGEPWGFDEVMTAGIFGGPQVLEHELKTNPKRVVDYVQDVMFPVRKFLPKIGTRYGDYVDPNTPFQMWSDK